MALVDGMTRSSRVDDLSTLISREFIRRYGLHVTHESPQSRARTSCGVQVVLWWPEEFCIDSRPMTMTICQRCRPAAAAAGS